MDQTQVMEIGASALVIAAKLAAPFLITAMAIGIVVGVFQSVTQVQEQTLTFVPKFVGVAVVVVIGGHWMVGEMVTFTRELLRSAPDLIG